MAWEFELIDPAYGGVSEGPAWDGSVLYFTHIQRSRILRYDPKKREVSIWRDNTECANGLAFDAEGRLLACQGGQSVDARRVVRYEKDGGVTVLADRFEGKRFNIPNDVVVDPKGRVWFTDPFYEGAAGPWSADRKYKELDHDSVYRLDPQGSGWSVARVTFDTTRPNGLLFSLDFRTLYVAQSGRLPEEKRQLRAHPVNEDGSLGAATVLHDFGAHRGIDGMRLDVDGNIVATAGWEMGGPGPMIYVFAPSGEVLEQHPIPAAKRPTNCCFGDDDLQTLYVTSIDGHLFRARTNRRGRPLAPYAK